MTNNSTAEKTANQIKTPGAKTEYRCVGYAKHTMKNELMIFLNTGAKLIVTEAKSDKHLRYAISITGKSNDFYAEQVVTQILDKTKPSIIEGPEQLRASVKRIARMTESIKTPEEKQQLREIIADEAIIRYYDVAKHFGMDDQSDLISSMLPDDDKYVEML